MKTISFNVICTDELLNMSHHLTTREFEIVKMIAKGQNSEQIAEKLFVSIHTVNTHRRNILHKSKKVHIYMNFWVKD